MKKYLSIMFILISLVAFGKKETVILGIPPWGGNSNEMKQKFEVLAHYLSEKTDLDIIMATTSDYEELGNAVSQGFIDIGIFPSSAYVNAKNKHKDLIDYLCTAKDLKSGKAYYESNIVTKKGSEIKSYKDLENKIIGFVDEKSSSGYKFPITYIISEWNIDPKSYFKKIFFLGSHPSVLKAIDNGIISVGAMGELENTARLANLNPNDFVVIGVVKNIPLDAVAVSSNMDKSIKKRIKRALISLNPETKTSNGRSIFSGDGITWSGFDARDDSFYDIIRNTNKILGEYNK